MKISKLIVYSILIGILAGVVTLLTDVLQIAGFITNAGSLTFITFITWASYFLFGANPKNATKAWFSMLAGIICAIVIYECVGVFAGKGLSVPYVALPAGVIVGVILMCLCERLPYANNVAAVFLGAGMFFGLMGTPAIGATGYITVCIGELGYAAIGLISGYLTVKVSIAVSNYGTLSAAATAAKE